MPTELGSKSESISLKGPEARITLRMHPEISFLYPPPSKDLRDRRSDVEVSNQIPGLSAREQPNFFPFLLVFLFLSFCSSRIPNPETRPAVSRITTSHPLSPSSAVLHLVTQSHCVFTTPSFVLFFTLQHF